MSATALLRKLDPAELDYSDRSGLLVSEIEIGRVIARVIKYAAGDTIPMHYHTKANVKFLLRGAIAFAGADGPLGVLEDGEIYWCGGAGAPYRGDVLRDSYLLIIEEPGSERINVD